MKTLTAYEKHLRIQKDELQRRYDTMTERISALDTDIGRELDAERKLALEKRRADIVGDRDKIIEELRHIEQLSSEVDRSDQGIGSGPQSDLTAGAGSTYTINIQNAKGIVIGDGATVKQDIDEE